MTAFARAPLVTRLAARDLSHGWAATLCLIVAVCVALSPLLMLQGLRSGVVTNLIDDLRSDPRIREIRLVRNLQLDQQFFDDLAADPRTGFLLPRARYLAASVRLRSEGGRSILEPRMIPTAEGDPLLAGLTLPEGGSEIAVTRRVAIEADVGPGDDVEMIVLRQVGDIRETLRHSATVVSVLPRNLLQTDDIFVAGELERAIERWREGFAVPEYGWEGVRDGASDADNRSFASFRLYAADVRDVPGLRDQLLARGLDVETRAEDIEQALAIEAGLSWVFLTVAVLTGLGFLLTLGLHLAASVVEKARELSILRLLGMRSAELALFPSVQGMLIAFLGGLAACLLALLAEPAVNRLLDGLAGLEGDVSRLSPAHLAIALGATVVAGGISGSLAGLRAAALEPTRGLRHD